MESPWPLFGGIRALLLVGGFLSWFRVSSLGLLVFGFLSLFLVLYQWWRDVVREGCYLGCHTSLVVSGLQLGMVLFIVSEVLFFFSMFWGFFHRRLVPTVELGVGWPPCGVVVLNSWGVPFLNTIVLLSSGVSVTWSHHCLICGDYSGRLVGLFFTLLLGGYFTFLQACEYYEVSFSIRDGIYGTVFFVMTGFHGVHVLVGTIFLLVCFFRVLLIQFSSGHHAGFEAGIWYWHFVDVVWLFLFVFVYWWSE